MPGGASLGTDTPDQVRALQFALRSLGYLKAGIDGQFGNASRKAITALQFDLLSNTGKSTAGDGDAPVAVRDYNRGRVTAVSAQFDQGLGACIADMMQDQAFPKLPSSDDPVSANRAALATVAALPSQSVPTPFLVGIVLQESGGKHYQEPHGGDTDSFVVVGLDTNDNNSPARITSRGYGMGQYTLFHHPPRPEEVGGFISDPAENVTRAVKELRDKFDHYVIGPISTANDRIEEVGRGPLRTCKYAAGDARYMSDCVQCLKDAGVQQITAGVTPVYAGSAMTYEQTIYHAGSYSEVPVRKNIACDWPYALRRYNGSNPNSYDYQAEALLKIVKLPQANAASSNP